MRSHSSAGSLAFQYTASPSAGARLTTSSDTPAVSNASSTAACKGLNSSKPSRSSAWAGAPPPERRASASAGKRSSGGSQPRSAQARSKARFQRRNAVQFSLPEAANQAGCSVSMRQSTSRLRVSAKSAAREAGEISAAADGSPRTTLSHSDKSCGRPGTAPTAATDPCSTASSHQSLTQASQDRIAGLLHCRSPRAMRHSP